MGRLFLDDVLPLHTIVALVLALGCMAIIFVPDILHDGENKEDGESNITEEEDDSYSYSPVKGNIIAFITGVLLAVYISIMRKGGTNNLNLVGVTSLAALLGAAIALMVQKGNVAPNSYWTGEDDDDGGGELWQFWLALLAQGLSLGIIFVTLTVAPRLATGAEVGLVLLLEVILGPLWVYFAYGDIPPVWTLIGGSM